MGIYHLLSATFPRSIRNSWITILLWCKVHGVKKMDAFFCAPAWNCLGVRAIATDASNTHLLNKIFLMTDLLEVSDIEGSEESKLKTKVSSQSYTSPCAPRTLEPIVNFSYTPRQKGSRGWRSTKSKLRLPRRPMRTFTVWKRAKKQ